MQATHDIITDGCKLFYTNAKIPFKNICAMWIKYVRGAKKVRYGKLDQIAPPSKQLIAEWISADVKSLHEKHFLLWA